MATKKKKRAVPLQGFPWKGKFKTMAEVDAYFDADEIPCLLCGKPCVSLHRHLGHSHKKVSVDRYREIYGIPWGRGLISRSMLKRLSYLMKKHKREGIVRRSPSKAHLKRLDSPQTRRSHRPLVEAVIHARRQHGLKIAAERETWDDKAFEEYLRRISTGRTVIEVGKDGDVPHHLTFRKYLEEHPAFNAKFERVWETLPFEVQARGRIFGKSLKKAVVELQMQGLSWSAIGRALNLERGTLLSVRRVLQASGELKKYRKMVR